MKKREFSISATFCGFGIFPVPVFCSIFVPTEGIPQLLYYLPHCFPFYFFTFKIFLAFSLLLASYIAVLFIT
jgi:hypothetical protein